MLEASYSARPPRVLVSDVKASRASDSRRLKVSGAPEADADALVDLSSRGLKMITSGAPPAVDTVLELELRHPKLKGTVQVSGRVRWVTPEADGTAKVGVVFEELRDTTKVAIAQLVAYNLADIHIKGGWHSPARLHLIPHVNAPVADLPVRRVIGGSHFVADLTLPYGRVLYDYLEEGILHRPPVAARHPPRGRESAPFGRPGGGALG